MGRRLIPTVGPLIGLTLFALVIAAYIGLAASWVAGMVFALKGTVRSLPVTGSWVTPRRKAAPPSETQIIEAAELIERPVTDV